jgi:LacI family transcriptional regulator
VFVTPDEPISPVRDRLAAYRDLQARDPDVLPPLLVPDLSLASGVEAARRLLAGGSLPAAVICVNDLTAIGAMQTLRSAGVDVPGTVAVTGVDDTPFAAMAEPSLTTVRQPMEQIGDEVVRTILRRIQEPGLAPRRLVLTAQLVVRQSTATSPQDTTTPTGQSKRMRHDNH